jgi:predicted dehydrogenase
MSITKIGVIGTGTISGIYLKNAAWLDGIEVVAVADLNRASAEKRAAEYAIPNVYSVDELLADPQIDIVLNLTTPNAHAAVAKAALAAGKSVYNEKPLALTRAEGQAMLAMAAERNLRIGCAPDTFLGAGHQTCRHVIDSGAIGRPVAATAFMMSYGVEMWHPNPEFYYKPGAGPMFDMGPYYLTALINMLGPVAAVSGMVTRGRKERLITSAPFAGQTISVDVPTHVAGTLQFASGAIGTMIMSFDIPHSTLPRIEIYGTEATLIVPDPNFFGGEVFVKRPGDETHKPVALTHAYSANERGLGLADMAAALRAGRPQRASGELSYHVLDLMWAFHDSAESQTHVQVESTCDRPEPFSAEAIFGLPQS